MSLWNYLLGRSASPGLSTFNLAFRDISLQEGAPAGTNFIQGAALADGDGNPVRLATPLPIFDTQSAPFGGAVAMAVGSSYAIGRSVGVLCTVAGYVEFQFADASTITLPVFVGWQTFPFACIAIVAGGTTATATFFNLK